mgnify:FL=1
MKVYVKIEGISCSHCLDTIETNLLREKNIIKVEFQKNIAIIEYVGKLEKKKIIKLINSLGYLTQESYISDDISLLSDKVKPVEIIIILLIIILVFYLLNKIIGFNIFNVIPTIDENITYGMLFVTGLLTSIHCVSMCGAINLLTVINKTTKRSYKKPILYNLGRLISYTALGGIVGLIGSVLTVNKTVTGIIILLASIVMFLMALAMLGLIHLKKLKLIRHKTVTANPLIIGLLNGLMPCGPLQAMQVYALSTGSPIKGAISMFLFCLGTIPLMLGTGLFLNKLTGKWKIIVNKIATCLILILSVVMLNQALLYLNIDLFKNNDDSTYQKAILKETYQEVKINVSYGNYQDIIIQKDIPVKLIIHVDEDKLTGCNNEIYLAKYKIKKKLKVGDNIIEFTPTKEETLTYTCYMNMIKNNIKVIDNKKYFERKS